MALSNFWGWNGPSVDNGDTNNPFTYMQASFYVPNPPAVIGGVGFDTVHTWTPMWPGLDWFDYADGLGYRGYNDPNTHNLNFSGVYQPIIVYWQQNGDSGNPGWQIFSTYASNGELGGTGYFTGGSYSEHPELYNLVPGTELTFYIRLLSQVGKLCHYECGIFGFPATILRTDNANNNSFLFDDDGFIGNVASGPIPQCTNATLVTESVLSSIGPSTGFSLAGGCPGTAAGPYGGVYSWHNIILRGGNVSGGQIPWNTYPASDARFPLDPKGVGMNDYVTGNYICPGYNFQITDYSSTHGEVILNFPYANVTTAHSPPTPGGLDCELLADNAAGQIDFLLTTDSRFFPWVTLHIGTSGGGPFTQVATTAPSTNYNPGPCQVIGPQARPSAGVTGGPLRISGRNSTGLYLLETDLFGYQQNLSSGTTYYGYAEYEGPGLAKVTTRITSAVAP